MKLRIGESVKDAYEREGEWHRWFAWHPVFIRTKDTRWLEYVERRRSYWFWTPAPWQYRPITKEVK
jgi:hypothetical protein